MARLAREKMSNKIRKNRTFLPLSSDERSQAEGIGDRLRAELSRLLSVQSFQEFSNLALSRHLGVNRNICQRVEAACASSITPIEVLLRVPGVEGLRLFVAGASAAAGLAAPDPTATASIEQFGAFIRQVAGSHSRLMRRLRVNASPQHAPSSSIASEDVHLEARKRLYQDAADVMGLSSDLGTNIAIIRPIEEDPKMMHGAYFGSLHGLRWDGRPQPIITQVNISRASEVGQSSNEQRHQLYDPNEPYPPLIEAFCSRPMPVVSTRIVHDLEYVMVDPSPGSEQVDIAMCFPWEKRGHPLYKKVPMWWSMFALRRPCKRSLCDVYLHRSMAVHAVPSVGAYRWIADMPNPTQQWHERYPGRYTLELLGNGLTNADSRAWSRHREATQYVFDRLGWDPEEFVGYRCDTMYPIWGSMIVMLFDFTEAAKALGIVGQDP